MSAGMPDPIAEALRPKFASAAKEARELIASGETGNVSVLSGHLPRATIDVLRDKEPLSRSFNMYIPSVVGPPGNPDSIISTFAGMSDLRDQDGVNRANYYVLEFETTGPNILASTIRSCLFGLLHAGVGHDLLISVIQDSVAAMVMHG